MTNPDTTARYCAEFVSGLADAGVEIVFISPGSRNTPLTIAFAREHRIRDISIRDERSAGFAALGYGKATGRPAAVLCTSGSAATHYFSSIVEANQSATPLIVITADRPARLRGTGAPQTTNQIDLFGGHVKSFTDLDTRGGNARSDGRIVVTLASVLPAGVVHANISFDEPLLPAELPAIAPAENWNLPAADEIQGSDLTASLEDADVLIVASGRQQPGFAASLNPVAKNLGAPIIADAQCWVTGPNTVAYGDLLASSTDAFTTNAPDIVLRLGPLPTSRSIWTWLEQSGVEQILVTSSRLRDPLGSAAVIVDADPTAFLRANTPAEPSGATAGDTTQDAGRGEFLDRWLTMDAAVGDAVADSLQLLTFPNEPEVARALVATAAPGDLVYLASSMPIRDVDTFAEPRSDVRVLANRGVNGIDGTISAAMGAALAGDSVTLLIGDIAALHDATALTEVARLGIPLRVVVVNNDGGGIFSFLPQARSETVDTRTFEQHWGTPHGLEFVPIANAFGLEARSVTTLDGFVEAVAGPIVGPDLIELRTDRQVNVQQHKAIRTAVRSILRENVE